MTQALDLRPNEAGPSSFVTSQDFISFDDFEDDANNSNVGESDMSKSKSIDAIDRRHDKSNQDSSSSSKVNGKKRKTDDRVEMEGKSKREKKREVARGTPWCEHVDFDNCVTSADVLHDELMAFADWISPTPREHETRKMVIQLISRAIVKQWPDAEVRAFGSQNTQLYMPQGDIDLVVISPRMEAQRTESVLRSMAVCLRRNNLATDVQVIGRAKVPIIKFTCTHGKYKVDISINHTNGIDASQFVAGWLRRCPALRPIIMATKLLLNQRGMSEVFSGGLGSYSVICMVISHVQMHPKVQRGEIDPSRNLGVLFLEFLELFGKNFGYDEVGISIKGGGSYYRKAARGWKDDRRPFMLSIEDPGDASNDIAKGSFSILNVRQTYGGAFDIMTAVMCQRATIKEESFKKKKKGSNGHRDDDEEARDALLNGARLGESDKDPESLLGNIIGVNREMIKARRDIDALWKSGTLQYLLGRSPPPRDPHPHEPARPLRLEERGPPTAPRAMRAEEERIRKKVDGKAGGSEKQPSKAPKVMLSEHERESDKDSRHNGGTTASTKHGISFGSKGTSVDPLIVLDSSSDSHLQKSNKANKDPSNLRLDESDSPIYVREDVDDEDVEADSKYATHQQNQKRKKKSSRLDDFAKVAPKTFVIDDSASDDENGNVSLEDGEAAIEAAPKRRRISSKEDEEKRRKRIEYWESKGNAATEISSGDDEHN